MIHAAGQERHGNMGQPVPTPGPVRIAYLTNVYPKISHSFIRNEILALERMDFAVTRLTIRTSPDIFSDVTDQDERDHTITLLDGHIMAMLWSAFGRMIRQPRAFLRALGVARSAFIYGTHGLVRCTAYFLEACRLADRMERAGLRHVHVHFGTNPATVARIASRLGAISYSLTMHGPDEFDAPERLQLGDKVADARFVVAISAFGRSQIMRWSAPRDWNKITVVRCGSDPLFMHHVTPITDTGLSDSSLICVARLSPQKGIALLIDAAAIVAKSHAFHLSIIGDGPMRSELEAQIEALDLQDVVTLCGWRDPQNVWREMLRARALVLSSFAEGLPVVIMEALALGRPVIATSISGISELVDRETGWIVPAGSVTALADAMIAALDTSTEQLRAMGEIGRERVRAGHDIDENVADLADLLRPLA
jgi:glycosyltransferase involved in cell wall biosynthesis